MTTVTRVETIRVSLPFETGGPRVGIRPAMGAWLRMESLMLRLETADGLEGWGEAFGHNIAPGTEAVLNEVVAPMLLGRDARDIAGTMDGLERPLHGFGRSGPAIYALSAVDIALWDLAGKRAGAPLFRLLGGGNAELRRYASLMRYGGDTDAVAANVTRAREAGFTTVKLHETTIPAFRAARRAVDKADNICLDVNCPWTPGEARAVAREIRGDGFHLAGGAGLARRRISPALAGVRGRGRGGRGGGEHVRPAGVQGGAGGGRGRCAAAERHQMRRRVGDAAGLRAGAGLAGPRRAALLLLGAGLPRDGASRRLAGGAGRWWRPRLSRSPSGRTRCSTPATRRSIWARRPGLGFEADWDALAPHVVSRRAASA